MCDKFFRRERVKETRPGKKKELFHFHCEMYVKEPEAEGEGKLASITQ